MSDQTPKLYERTEIQKIICKSYIMARSAEEAELQFEVDDKAARQARPKQTKLSKDTQVQEVAKLALPAAGRSAALNTLAILFEASIDEA